MDLAPTLPVCLPADKEDPDEEKPKPDEPAPSEVS